jgi:hypothetical protein|nr:MAG TPA: hypothetical protein [Caudoviricetes sp.]
MKDLAFIEDYIKNKKYNNPDFSISWGVTLDGKIEYWVKFSMTDDEDNDYTDYVQFIGDNLEEALGKIVEYLKSGKHYRDGRYL